MTNRHPLAFLIAAALHSGAFAQTGGDPSQGVLVIGETQFAPPSTDNSTVQQLDSIYGSFRTTIDSLTFKIYAYHSIGCYTMMNLRQVISTDDPYMRFLAAQELYGLMNGREAALRQRNYLIVSRTLDHSTGQLVDSFLVVYADNGRDVWAVDANGTLVMRVLEAARGAGAPVRTYPCWRGPAQPPATQSVVLPPLPAPAPTMRRPTPVQKLPAWSYR